MNRRNFLLTTGSVVTGSAVGFNALSRDALAVEYEITSQESYSYVQEPRLFLSFEKFHVTASSGVDTSKDLEVTLKAGLDENDSVDVVERDSNTYKVDGNGDVSDELNDDPLEISGGDSTDIVDTVDSEDGAELDLLIQLKIEWDETTVSTREEKVTVEILPEQNDISDSAVNRWPIDEGSGSTITDSIGSQDGTVNGATWTSGTWLGDWALDGDGTDDGVNLDTLGNFGGYRDGPHAVALTAEIVSGDNGYLLGARANSADDQMLIGSRDYYSNQGEILLYYRVGGNETSITTDSNYDDDQKHRIVANKTGPDASDLEIWIDGVQVSTRVTNSGFIDSAVSYDTSALFHNAGGVGYSDSTIDDVILFNDSLSSNEISDDYDRQPWS